VPHDFDFARRSAGGRNPFARERVILSPVHPQTILILVRHGETTANTDGVWHGSTDTPLNARGEEQASRVAQHIRASFPDAAAVYTSDLQRARRTAEAIGAELGLTRRLEVGLREYHLGSWEGKTYSELYHEHKLWHHIRKDPDFAPHGGESPRQAAERLTAALRQIAAGHPRERVVVVTHAGALSMAMGAILDGSYTQWRSVMDNCAVSELVFEPEPELLSFNVTDHLAAL
jgi:broad specificity phosphatase PhoE